MKRRLTARLARLAAAIAVATAIPASAEELSLERFTALLTQVFETHPEIAEQAVSKAQAKAAEAAQAKAKLAGADLIKRASAREPGMPILGNPAAPITIVEALDYHCGFCRIMHPRMKEIIKARPDVRIAVMMTPVLGRESEIMARFALAAAQQGKFAAVHDAFYTVEGKIDTTDAGLTAIATKLGLDWTKIQADMNSETVNAAMNRTRGDWEALNRPGTPHIVLAGKTFAGAAETKDVLAALPPQKGTATASLR